MHHAGQAGGRMSVHDAPLASSRTAKITTVPIGRPDHPTRTPHKSFT
ncbi:hypothetical protein STXM2123_3298 [Streptomyces sp. F-3]|nr:hypothetical protein STXM2123_3298 [Streptomyces sp. F-3]